MCNFYFKSPSSKHLSLRKSASLVEENYIVWIAPDYEVLIRNKYKKKLSLHIYHLGFWLIIFLLEIQSWKVS